MLLTSLNVKKIDRILSLVFSVVIAALPYLFVFEINRCILVCFLQKITRSISIFRVFSKTPWACEKRYHRLFIQKITYHQSLIYIIIAGGCKLKIRYTYWQRFIFPRNDSCVWFRQGLTIYVLPLLHRAIHRFCTSVGSSYRKSHCFWMHLSRINIPCGTSA